MKAIVIGTANGREDWLRDCLESLRGYTRYPILVVNQYDWELGKIYWVYEYTNLDEFIFLQDSVVVKDYKWIDEAFDYDGSVSIGDVPFFMYLGKYTRKNLDRVTFPAPATKKDAIIHEIHWTRKYVKHDLPTKYTMEDLKDTDIFEEHNGRKNMILENDHIKKYKGTWSMEMLGN